MRKIRIVLAALLMAGVLCACADTSAGADRADRKDVYARTFAEAERLNAHSDFGEFGEHELLQESSQEVIETYKAGKSESFSAFGEDGYSMLSGEYSPYPYDSDTLRLTEFFVNSTDVHVYGIRIGDTLEEGFQSLIELGYTEEGRGEANIAAQKDNISIHITANATTLRIDQINVAVYDPLTPDPLSQSQADYSFHRDEVYVLAQELNDNSDFGGLSLTGFVPKDLRSKLGYKRSVTDSLRTENIEALYESFDYDYRLMGLFLKSDAYNVLGVKVGDSVADGGEKLTELGYAFIGKEHATFITMLSSSYSMSTYSKGEYARSTIFLCTEPNGTEIVLIYVGLSDNYLEEF